MYIPKDFKQTDQEIALDFISHYPFGILISVNKGKPEATHLPFVISVKEKGISLKSHLSRLNPQSDAIGKSEFLIIFQGPYGYISPSNYSGLKNVPTWNYITLHARGYAYTSNDDNLTAIMEEMINTFEPDYMQQWNDLPNAYKHGLYHGLVAFELKVESFEMAEKISQDRAEEEKRRITTSLINSELAMHNLLGAYMKNKYAYS